MSELEKALYKIQERHLIECRIFEQVDPIHSNGCSKIVKGTVGIYK